MTDRELLELTAKAAGIDCVWDGDSLTYKPRFETHWVEWNPLTDDGDALRLAVKLGIEFGFGWDGGSIVCVISSENLQNEWVKNDDPYAATRRAIVRAAAEIGKGMK